MLLEVLTKGFYVRSYQGVNMSLYILCNEKGFAPVAIWIVIVLASGFGFLLGIQSLVVEASSTLPSGHSLLVSYWE